MLFWWELVALGHHLDPMSCNEGGDSDVGGQPLMSQKTLTPQ